MNGNVTEERIDEVVKLLGMGQVIDRKVKAYSLGMRQRLESLRHLFTIQTC